MRIWKWTLWIICNNVCWYEVFVEHNCCHSLRGLCGLKSDGIFYCDIAIGSQPARAVWIEIQELVQGITAAGGHSLRGLCGLKFIQPYLLITDNPVTACEGCVDWNVRMARLSLNLKSHSLRGLCGLKYIDFLLPDCSGWVTACEGCVDWNLCLIYLLLKCSVTACEGCVDWNKLWLKEVPFCIMSQPARAVWIEISPIC